MTTPPRVLCLHCSASSGAQWRGLVATLGAGWRASTPDLTGYGRDADPEAITSFVLGDDVGSVVRWIDAEPGPAFLVGHSYGGLIALLAAARRPDRVGAVAVYEPAAWSLVVEGEPATVAAGELRRMADETGALTAEGRADEAAEAFVRFWAGDVAWRETPEARRRWTARSMHKVRHEFRAERAAWHDGSAGADAYRAVRAPALLLTGSRSPGVARRAVELLAQVLPEAVTATIDGAGHMGPVTHAATVDARLLAFLEARHGAGRG